MELLIGVALVLLVIVPVVYLFYTDIQTRINIAKARDAVDKIVAAAEYVSKLGDGSQIYVEVAFPRNVKSINVSEKEIVIQLYTPSGVTDVYASCDCNLTGFIPKLEGYRKIRVMKNGNRVVVGKVLYFQPSYVYFELTRGESATKEGIVSNPLPFPQTVNYTLEDPTGWVTFNAPMAIDAESSVPYHLNVNVSNDADKGRYFGRVRAETTYGVEFLDYVIRVVGNLSQLLIQHQPTYFPGDLVTIDIYPYDNFGENVNAQINTTVIGPNQTIVQQEYTNHQVIQFVLSSNCSVSCGEWNITSIATKRNTVTNHTSFKVGALALINFCSDENCSSYVNTYNFSDWWNNSWPYRIQINVSASAEMRKLDVLLHLNASNFDFSKANPDGSDIRIVTQDGVVRPIYIEYWNYTAKEATIWFDADVLPGSNTFYIYFGNPNASSVSDPESVFDFYDDVNTTKWSASGLWHVTGCDYHSPTKSWWYAVENVDCSGDYDTGSRNYGYIKAGPIDLSDTANEQVFVKFWRWYEIEYYSHGAYDVMRFQVSRNGASWSTLKQWDSRQPDEPYWVNDSVEITSYSSSTFYMRFYFDTIDAWYNDHKGWKIDDVVIVREGSYTLSFGRLEEYGKMYVEVNLSDLNGNPKDGSVNFTLKDANNQTKISELASGSSHYLFNYTVGPGDPSGNWTAIVLWQEIYLKNQSSVEVIP